MHLRFPGALPDHALQLRLLEAGTGQAGHAGWVHEKTVPYAIIAEAVRGRYELEAGGVRLLTGPGEAWVTPPGLPLRITHRPDPRTGAPTAFRYLHFAVAVEHGLDVTQLLRLPLKLSCRVYAPVGAVIGELLQRDSADARQDLGWCVRRTELACTVLRLLCEAAEPAPSAALRLARTRRLGPLDQYLRANLAAPVTVPDMAAVCGLSLSGFHRFFRQQADVSPMHYLKRLRLDEAAHLLLSTDLALEEIADRTGFANAFHFSREFKRGYGRPPSAYRLGPYRSGRLPP
jgi:AraC-like DNA-binding protein